jgi:hypothetical protein
MQWLPITTWQYRFQDKETMDALSKGEAINMWTGKPKGRPSWGNKNRPEWRKWRNR